MVRQRSSAVAASASGRGRVSVRFIAQHTHAGVQHLAGDRIDDVHPGDAHTMRQFGVIGPQLEAGEAEAPITTAPPEFVEPITIEPDPDAIDAFDSGGE